MPAPLKPHLFPVVLHDQDAAVQGTAGNPVHVTGVIGDVVPGTVITTSPDTAVGVGATVALTVPPGDTRRMRVQVTVGDDTTRIRVREVGGAAGSGDLLILLGSTLFGGADGAVAPLEVENVAGPAAAVMTQFERD
ncbi:MAG: hypothetical protein ACREDF_09600 [Thermoplasmata archaeon]